jgi:hypothetical protein
MPEPDSEWFFPVFVVGWLAISGALSLIGGWHHLAERFASDAPLDGERFRFRSGSIGWTLFPVGYGNCLFATVGSKGFALSMLIFFRFLHPRLVIPWSAVERCENVRFFFIKHVAVYIAGFNRRRLLFSGSLGRKILEEWTKSSGASLPKSTPS